VALVGEHTIGGRQSQWRRGARAQRKRQIRRQPLGGEAELASEVDRVGDADGAQRADSGKVARFRQRLTYRDRTDEAIVIVRRLPARVVERRVVDQRAGRNAALSAAE
jgi:hypothetical protein